MSSRDIQDMSEWYHTGFQSFEQQLNGQKSSPLHDIRVRAMQQFAELGFPTPKNEDWKYTNVEGIARGSFKLASKAPMSAEELGALVPSKVLEIEAAARLVFVNGHFAEDLSQTAALPAGTTVRALSDVFADKADSADRQYVESEIGSIASFEKESFTALNTAFVSDGVFINLPENTTLDKPVVALFVLNNAGDMPMTANRIFLNAAAGSSMELLECHAGPEELEYFSNSVLEFRVDEKADIKHYRLQLDGQSAYSVSSVAAAQGDESRFTSITASLGGKLTRNNIASVLNGEEVITTFNGLSVLDGNQHVDNATVLDHAKPNSESHELYKGMYGDSSRGVFSGTIIVRPDAQKTNAFQSNSGLLLSDDASFDTKPQLKIWADDVKCSHGATVGQIDDDGLFYLRSRGISEKDARRILVRAYASDVVESIENESMQAIVDSLVDEKLERIQSK